MTTFTDSIDSYCKGYSVAPGCKGKHCEHNPERSHDHQCEPNFSNRQCDSCGSTYAGDRQEATMIPLDYKAGEDTMIEAIICVDCLLYWANGDEPDEPWYRTPQDYRETLAY